MPGKRRVVEKVRLQKWMQRGRSATIGENESFIISLKYVNNKKLRTKDTGLGWPMADQNKRAIPVTMWYPDDTINPLYMNSWVVLQVVRHVSTSGPNLKVTDTRQCSTQPNTLRCHAPVISKPNYRVLQGLKSISHCHEQNLSVFPHFWSVWMISLRKGSESKLQPILINIR